MKTKFLLIAMLFGIVTISQAQEAQIASAKKSIASLNAKEKVINTEKHNLNREIKDLKKSEVNSRSKAQFKADFGVVSNITWVRESNVDVANFKRDNQLTKAYYDSNSQLIGTTVTKKDSELPLMAQKTLKDSYDDYTVTQILYFDDNDSNNANIILLGNEFEDKDCYIIFLTKGNDTRILQITENGEIAAEKSL
ncbi:hypothetical protein [Flavobacterium sp.]